MSIAENVAIGKEVMALLALADDWDDAHFIRLRDQLLTMHPLPVPDRQQPMTDKEMARFEMQFMTFGKYANVPMGEVPLDYLDWLCRTQEGFYRDLRRYLLERTKNDTADEAIDP